MFISTQIKENCKGLSLMTTFTSTFGNWTKKLTTLENVATVNKLASSYSYCTLNST